MTFEFLELGDSVFVNWVDLREKRKRKEVSIESIEERRENEDVESTHHEKDFETLLLEDLDEWRVTD